MGRWYNKDMNTKSAFAGVGLLAVTTAFGQPLRTATITVGYEGAPVANFPVPVRISPQTIQGFDSADCAADGGDIRFVAADGTPLAFEKDRWDPSGESVFWVQLPELKKGVTFKLTYMDEGGASPLPATNIWSAVGYAGVWHLDEASGTAACSTTNDWFTGTPAGEGKANMIAEDGILGQARRLAKTGSYTGSLTTDRSYMTFANYSRLPITTDFTFSGWYYIRNQNGNSKYTRIVARSKNNSTTGWGVQMQDAIDAMNLYDGNGKSVKTTSKVDLRNKWCHIAFVYAGTTASIYVNGACVASGTIVGAMQNTRTIGVGNSDGNQVAWFDGALDETRFCGHSLDGDWLAAEYASVAQEGFLDYAPAVAVGGLTVVGVPERVGVAEPDYGGHAYSTGDRVDCTVTAALTNGDVAVECTGWTLERKDEPATSGAGNRYEYVHAGDAVLAWSFAKKYRFTSVIPFGGTVTTSGDGWYVPGTEVRVTATPDADCVFERWTGEGVDPQHATDNPYVFTSGEAPVSMTANFRRIRYVAVTGSDANDGKTPDAAYLTISKAIAEAGADEPTTVYVGPGTYTATNKTASADGAIYALTLNKPVRLIATAGPAETTVNAGTDTDRALCTMTHAGAMVAGFALKNGHHYDKNKPTGFEASAGVISNCWLKCRGEWAHDGWVYKGTSSAKAYDLVMLPHNLSVNEGGYPVYLSGNATLDGFVATNTVISGKGGKAIVYLAGSAQARDMLIADCTFGGTPVESLNPMVTLDGAKVVVADATVVNNTITANNGAFYVKNSTAIATNCIVWGNVSTSSAHPNIHGGSNLGRYFHCCCNEFAVGNANGNITGNPQFVNAEAGDYRLRSLSPAKDMGATWLRPSGGEDEFACAADADVYVSASGEALSPNFIGYCGGAKGAVTAVWDFGDGETVTTWPTATHTYATPGSYNVTLTVRDGVSEPAVYAFPKSFVVTPVTCYVKEGGDGTYPYDTWEKATSNLAVACAVGSRNVVVTNGTYDIRPPFVDISRALSLTSVEGPEKTTLRSVGSGDRRHFLVTQSDGALIAGFTLTGGYAANYGWTATVEMGKGVLSNCVIRKTGRVSRSAAAYFYGTAKAVDCVFDGQGMTRNNDLDVQSGVRIEGSAVLDRCVITSYRIDTHDGATYDGEAPVRIASSTAVLRNSLVTLCTNGLSAAAQYRGAVALVNGTIENCTIVGNWCGGYGGGVWAKNGKIVNSIVWGNTARKGGTDLYAATANPTVSFSCASDIGDWTGKTGEGNIADDPKFRARGGIPYQLRASSPCRDKADPLVWMTSEATDLLGHPRCFTALPDMGCYECLAGGLVLLLK